MCNQAMTPEFNNATSKQIFLTVDILSCHSRKTTAVTYNVNNNTVPISHALKHPHLNIREGFLCRRQLMHATNAGVI